MSKCVELNKKLLELAEFHGEELDAFLPRWMEATEIIGLSDENVEFAINDFIPTNWDIKFKGLRMMIGAFLREIVDLVVGAREKKKEGKPVVYGIIPCVPLSYYTMKSARPDMYVGFPDFLLVNTINSFFHNAAPYINYAEEIGFTYGCRHCPLNKMRVSAFAKKILVAPNVIWSWGMNCDEGPKTDEFIQCLVGEEWTAVVSRIAHDTKIDETDYEDEERIKYLSGVFKDGIRQIHELTGIEINETALKDAQAKNLKYSFKYGQLVSLVCKADPVPIGGNALTQFAMPMVTAFNNGYTYMEPAIDVLLQEIRAEIKAGNGVTPKGAPKLGSYFVPFCIPWVDRLFRENGVATTFSETMTPSKSQMSPHKYATDIYSSFAEEWLRFPMGQNMGCEVESMVEKVNANQPDGMLMGFFDFDRWLGAHQKMCADLVEKKTGVPHFYMESDFWDDRDYSEEALRTRIESISQLLYMKKEMK